MAAKIWRKTFADFRFSISRKIGRNKFHDNSSAKCTNHEIKFFHRETLGARRHKISRAKLFYLQLRRFLLTFELLCLQSVKVLLTRTFLQCKKRAPTASQKALVAIKKKLPNATVGKKAQL